jgi:hypothetical protein
MRAILLTIRVSAGRHVQIEDVTRLAAFEIRCTRDVLVVQSAKPQAVASEIRNAGAVLAHVVYQTIIGSDEHPFVSIAALKNEDAICDVRINLGTEDNPE